VIAIAPASLSEVTPGQKPGCGTCANAWRRADILGGRRLSTESEPITRRSETPQQISLEVTDISERINQFSIVRNSCII
jgi:hypothetical protein